jgi:hypothetical protein
MRFLRPSRRRAAFTGAVMALGLITALAIAGTPATAATSSSGHISTATQETHAGSPLGVQAPSLQALAVAKERHAGYEAKTLVNSPWGLHTPSIQGGVCSSGTAHWFTIHINLLSGPNGWFYQCFGYQGTWYFPANAFNWACAGNNHGTFALYPISGGTQTIRYSAGWSSNFNSLDDADYITINGWSGSYNCP